MTRTIRCIVGVVTLGVMIFGAATPTTAQFENSAWNSDYGQYQGPATAARVQFQGPHGSYDVNGSTGRLSGVSYYRDQNTGAVNAITGYWAFVGQNGWFQFKIAADGQSFQGSWGYGGFGSAPSGYWNGRRIGGPVPPPGGPVPPPGEPVPPPQ